MQKKVLISALTAVAAIITLFFFDTRILQDARRLIPADLYFIPKMVTNWGLYLFYAVFAYLFGYSFFKKNRELSDRCLAYLKAQFIFSFALVRFLKIVCGRARPGYGAEFTFFSFHSHYNSFPSGHAADAFVSGVFLYYLLKHSNYARWRFLPPVFAFLIAISRVFVGVHYPADVAAGMLIGVCGAWFFISRLPERR